MPAIKYTMSIEFKNIRFNESKSINISLCVDLRTEKHTVVTNITIAMASK